MAKRGKQKQKGKASAAAAKSVPTPAPVSQVADDAVSELAEGTVADEAILVEALPEEVAPAEETAPPAEEVALPSESALVEAAAVETEAALLIAVQDETAEAAVADMAELAPAEAAPDAPVPVVEVRAPKRSKRAPRKSTQPREQRSALLVLADYEQRSLAHVAGLPEQLDAPGLWRGVAYRVGAHRLASSFGEVIEILPLPALTHVPGSQTWMLGVANIRGTLLPVVDLKQFLEGERTVLHERQRVLVMRQPGGDVAITIDELYGQRSFVDAQGISAETISEGRYAHFIDRAYRVNEQDWGVFSFDRLARTPEFRQAAA